jgi:hypothetical protein
MVMLMTASMSLMPEFNLSIDATSFLNRIANAWLHQAHGEVMTIDFNPSPR